MSKKQKPQYEILLYWDEADEIYIAKVPDLLGCMAHGSTYEEAAKEINKAIDLWIETCVDDGIKVPIPTHNFANNIK